MPNLTLSQDIDDFLSSANKAAARSALGLGSAALASSDSFASLGSNTLTGLLSFSGTTHAGIRMNNLTTAQKNALTPAAGMAVFDTDLGRFQSYSGAAWVSHVRLTGDTMTGALAITQGTVNTGILSSTGYSLTGSNATNMLDLAGTWNTSGTPTAFKLNITNTASNAASLLMDLQSSTVSKFKVAINGVTTITSSESSLGSVLTLAGYYSTCAFRCGGAGLVVSTQTSVLGAVIAANDASYFGIGTTTDAFSYREAAQHWTHRNGTTAQILSVANTWTSTTNFERFKIDWVGTPNVCRIGTSKGGGGGSTRAMHLEVGDSAAIKISTAGGIDFAMLATTTETIIPDKTITVSIAGVSVKIPCL